MTTVQLADLSKNIKISIESWLSTPLNFIIIHNPSVLYW